MNRKRLIARTGALAAVLVLLTCLIRNGARSLIGLGMDISRPAGEAALFFKASITNRTSRPVKLNGSVEVTYTDEAGRGVATDFMRLAGSGTDIGGLQPQAFETVSLRAPDPIRGVRLRFSYVYATDPVRKAISGGLTGLGLRPKYPPNAFWRWMMRNGLLDGHYHLNYDRTWLAPTNLFQQ